ncbi:peroxiredoxin [Phaeobacter italicus]|uniref:peroxiredoxin n=1 Tax=Phaeobacter italicus TaxID=481446 RepID=UPI001C976D50|nr:peroxiredoxin [Phaeobacter italicus]MBY6045982.1 peroxiredoxin [Phaeobacter italicus]
MHATLPHATLQTRVRIDDSTLENPFEWCTVTTSDICAGRRIVIFAVPAAFSPTCSDEHLPGFEQLFDDIRAQGIDDVYCLSVNDAFVMFRWAQALEVQNVKMLPDGNGELTRKLGMLVEYTDDGMGLRSWRYAMVVNDGRIECLLAEPGFGDNAPDAPMAASDAGSLLAWLKEN